MNHRRGFCLSEALAGRTPNPSNQSRWRNTASDSDLIKSISGVIAQANGLLLTLVTPGRLQVSKQIAELHQEQNPITEIQHLLCARWRSILVMIIANYLPIQRALTRGGAGAKKMVSRLFRPFQGSSRCDDDEDEREPLTSPGSRQYLRPPVRHAVADFTEADDDDDEEDEDEEDSRNEDHGRTRNEEQENEDGFVPRRDLLPLFAASHLDSLPIYSITHAVRIIVQARTETTLTWEQLRSPQVSQFLLKPMQIQIRTQHFSRATLYALMANCLNFQKEAVLSPGNAGANNTRAKVCELLAIKLLKEYSTRELIDALSYDFYPLQGLPGVQTPAGNPGRPKMAAARTSTLEVAIRASAKHLLAHPLVVQQLEAIWNGAIVFYSAADSLHRASLSRQRSEGRHRDQPDARTPLLDAQHRSKWNQPQSPPLDGLVGGHRTVSLYNPRNASLFKLSRLRVPRYRHFLSTLSLAVLIGLFLAVLNQRATRISSLELIFWFWSAGFMLDELVGFNEQGFSLYIMSFWNIFDLGILLMLILYYVLRLYSVFSVDATRLNDLAYDVLAANGILLLPRIFSVLDHYQYFSQLLIAFRLMALDLAAVLVLVLICCSGFFVFFTMSKSNGDKADIAYRIFQILMGFTPAAWDVWPHYDVLGKMVIGLFLTICHFVVVTILITVLTNSFMTIASNAREEHQFLFAINTISMVKNDALFSYIAPGNILAWLLTPLRFILPLRQFVYLNRFVIKLTHFPLLFCIYLYERFFLAPSMYAPTDLVENPGRGQQRAMSLADPAGRGALFSPNVRVREESVVGYQKDHALEEVFRRAPGLTTLRTQRRNERRQTQTAIRHWMDQNEGYSESPQVGNLSAMGSNFGGPEWQRRISLVRDRPRRFPNMPDVRSVASDPADLISNAPYPSFVNPRYDVRSRFARAEAEIKDNTDAEGDGDDELVTNDDEDEDDKATNTADPVRAASSEVFDEDYFTTPVTARFGVLAGSSPESHRERGPISPRPRKGLHNRTLSTNTILYNPPVQASPEAGPSSLGSQIARPTKSRPTSNRQTPAVTPGGASEHRSPRRSIVYLPSARPPRPIPPPRDIHTAPNRAGLGPPLDTHARRAQRRLSSYDIGMDGESEMASASAILPNGGDDALVGAMPSSFVTQMAMATGMRERQQAAASRDNSDRMSRLVLARMKTLEEGFADVIREVKVLQQQRSSGNPSINPSMHNSGEEEYWRGSPRRAGSGSGLVEVAGRNRVTRYYSRGNSASAARAIAAAARERPASRLSMREDKVGMPVDTKGKGKEVKTPAEYDDTDDDVGFDDSFTKRGSSL
ncbi:hypothetical protein M0657_007768 [Pyricularia oryzae]|nr:hypothetical protein M0657_007768 [Pyricularia oryzae]KAI7918563.1 hypothetical protein M9X92_006829 [Pyricularia oryzae]